MKVFCGIDWAESHHDIALVDESGQQLAKVRIPDNAAGYRVLLDLLAEHGDTAEAPIPVAIETGRGLLVAAIRTGGRPVFAINPLAAARYRDRHGVARAKSDPADARMLANILRTDMTAHRTLPNDSELARAVSVLARAQQDAVWNRQQLTNQLRSLLREYYPAGVPDGGGGGVQFVGENGELALQVAEHAAGQGGGERADRDQGDPLPGVRRRAARRRRASTGVPRRGGPRSRGRSRGRSPGEPPRRRAPVPGCAARPPGGRPARAPNRPLPHRPPAPAWRPLPGLGQVGTVLGHPCPSTVPTRPVYPDLPGRSQAVYAGGSDSRRDLGRWDIGPSRRAPGSPQGGEHVG